MNPILAELVGHLPSDDIYPVGVVAPIRPKVRGRSFFPGGCGLFDGESQDLRSRPIVLVGQDFGTLEYWKTVPEAGETRDGTWSAMERLLEAVNIRGVDCFFTNALLGVRVQGDIEGPSPGLPFRQYVEASLEFLLEQIRSLQPSVVVALGIVPSVLLAHRFSLGTPVCLPYDVACHRATWRSVDQAIPPFVEEVSVAGTLTFAFATSVHPVRHWLNWQHRTWVSQGLLGKAAHDGIWQHVAAAHRSCGR